MRPLAALLLSAVALGIGGSGRTATDELRGGVLELGPTTPSAGLPTSAVDHTAPLTDPNAWH